MVVLCAFSVKLWKEGPHVAKPDGLTKRVAPDGETLLVSTTEDMTGGAHLNESVVLPRPVLCEKVMVIGFVVHMTLGEEDVELASAMEEVARTDPMITARTI